MLNETGLVGIRVTSSDQNLGRQPVLGIIDCGASFSVANWAAAKLLGLPPKEEKFAYRGSQEVLSVGVDGKPLRLPMKDISLTFAGDSYKDKNGGCNGT